MNEPSININTRLKSILKSKERERVLELYFNMVRVGNFKARILNESEIEEFYDKKNKERNY